MFQQKLMILQSLQNSQFLENIVYSNTYGNTRADTDKFKSLIGLCQFLILIKILPISEDGVFREAARCLDDLLY